MNLHKTYYSLITLVAILLVASCSREGAKVEPSSASMETIPTYDGPTTGLNINLDAGLDPDGLRAFDGLETGEGGRLFPASTDGSVQGVLILGNALRSSQHVLTFKYDKQTRRVSYKGRVANIPENVLTGAVKARVVVFPEGWYDSRNRRINVPQQFATEPAAGQPIGIKLPYFSDWQAVSVQKDERIPTDVKGLVFRPQGQIIRLQVSNIQTEMSDVRLHKFIFESNVMSRSGYYSLALTNSSVEPSYTPSERVVAGTSYYRHDVKLPQAQRVDRGIAKNYYLWVEGRNNVAEPYTRTLMSVRYMDPILSPSSDAWWVGKDISEANSTDDYKVVAVGYNNSAMQSAGATYRLQLSNRNAFTPLSRFSFYYMSSRAIPITEGRGYGVVDEAPAQIQSFAGRFEPGHTRYTLTYLRGQNNYLASSSATSPTALPEMLTPEYKNRGVGLQWRIPNLNELRGLLPGYSNSLSPTEAQGIFSLGSTVGTNATTNEQVNLGDGNRRYSASYTRIKTDEIQGLRFMGFSDLRKCLYIYRIQRPAGRPKRTQVQAHYLGQYYPEIKTAADLATFKGILPTIDERIIAWNHFYEENQETRGMLGSFFWISNVGNSTYYRVKLDHNTGSISEERISATDMTTTAGVYLIRDIQ